MRHKKTENYYKIFMTNLYYSKLLLYSTFIALFSYYTMLSL